MQARGTVADGRRGRAASGGSMAPTSATDGGAGGAPTSGRPAPSAARAHRSTTTGGSTPATAGRTGAGRRAGVSVGRGGAAASAAAARRTERSAPDLGRRCGCGATGPAGAGASSDGSFSTLPLARPANHCNGRATPPPTTSPGQATLRQCIAPAIRHRRARASVRFRDTSVRERTVPTTSGAARGRRPVRARADAARPTRSYDDGDGAATGGAPSGSRSVKSEPIPGVDVTSTRPPSRRASRWAMWSPRPVPP